MSSVSCKLNVLSCEDLHRIGYSSLKGKLQSGRSSQIGVTSLQDIAEKMLPSGVLEGGLSVLASFGSSCCVHACHGFAVQLSPPVVRLVRKSGCHQADQVRAVISKPSAGDNAGDSSAADFVKRAERAWMIYKESASSVVLRVYQQPRPLKCASCEASGSKECVWCKGSGFFILGDSMLCEVPSRNTTCVICAGQGVIPCTDCKGTGFRAQWLGPPLQDNHKLDHEAD